MRQLRSYFLSSISHEFRTPLSALNASMELLMSETDFDCDRDARTDEAGASQPHQPPDPDRQPVGEQQHRSRSLRPAAGTRLSESGHCECQAGQQPLPERRIQSLAVSEPTFLPRPTGDAARLTQVLVNLLTNASKYSPMHSIIHLVVERSAQRWCLFVIDQEQAFWRRATASSGALSVARTAQNKPVSAWASCRQDRRRTSWRPGRRGTACWRRIGLLV